MHVCTVAFGSGREGGTCWKDQRFLLKWLRYRPEHDVKLLGSRPFSFQGLDHEHEDLPGDEVHVVLKVTKEKRTCSSWRRRSSSAPRCMLLAPPPTSLERGKGTKDVSCAKAKTIMRNVIRDSEGNDIPTDTAKVKPSVESASEGAAPLAAFIPNVSELTAGIGEV